MASALCIKSTSDSRRFRTLCKGGSVFLLQALTRCGSNTGLIAGLAVRQDL